ncbi:Ectonucleoside triphosphate diphosphohydrolase 8, partial [Dryobates pubescens]
AIAGALVALSITALVLSLVRVEDVPLPPTVKYGMVFDAGSSHTSLFVYQWDADKENSTGVVSQTLACDVQGQGISSYASDPPRAGDSLRECLEQGLEAVPAAEQRNVPAYLGATAGMRLLREQNSSAADQVLAEVTKTMREYPVAFKGAQILTGEEEAAYGWITTNYLLDSFTKYSPRAHAWLRPEAANLLGALDLGGASTQISFVPAGPGLKRNGSSRLTLYGFSYSIYTHSYLCYGQNEVLRRLAKQLIEVRGELALVVSLSGAGGRDRAGAGVERALHCSNHDAARRGRCAGALALVCRGRGLGLGLGLQGASRTRRERGAAAQGSLLELSTFLPPAFQAFSAFYYNFKFLNLTEGQPPAAARDTIQRFCSRSWGDLSASYPQENPARLPKYCASANYILTLLLDAYKFNESSWKSISFQMKAGSADVGWTLGYMLNLTNLLPAEAPAWAKGQAPALWAAAVAFIVLTLALGLAALLL